jgi:hypothetical protein
MDNMKEHFPIEVIIPQPWRTIGRLFVFVAPFLFAYSMPLFLNRYPSCFVRLLGREYVIRLIADSKRYFLV